MRYQATPIVLTAEEQSTLESWLRATTTEQRMLLRARIILFAADGTGTNAIAELLKTRPATVTKWRKRFSTQRMLGLHDSPRPGQPRVFTAVDGKRILDKLRESPPKGYAQWNGRLLAEALSLSKDFVWSVLRQHGIQLERRHSWCIGTDPQFAPKSADVVGLYLHPPENAFVVSVDEKPHIQALERAQGYLKMPNGKTMTGFAHEYKRHGTTTLFAALDIVTGQVKIGHYKRRRRIEFLDFMNQVIKTHPNQEIHVILDNLNTHKPKHDMWLAKHKNVHFHFTPTHASWLNQIETWFSILDRHALKNASFTSIQQVRKAIDDFIEAYNPMAHPFHWTKEVVYQKTLKPYYAN